MNKQQAEFLSILVPIVQRQVAMHGSKLFTSVTLAQAIHESNWRTTKEAISANALFKVKVGEAGYRFGKAWDGTAYKNGNVEHCSLSSKGFEDYYRQYNTIEDCVCDYLDILSNSQRYKCAISRPNPKKSIEGILAGNFNTDTKYLNSLLKIIFMYNLEQYDLQIDTLVCPFADTTKTLNIGLTGEDVKYLQWMLNHSAELDILIDGVFGPDTERKLKQFQKEKHLDSTGIADTPTWKMLNMNLDFTLHNRYA